MHIVPGFLHLVLIRSLASLALMRLLMLADCCNAIQSVHVSLQCNCVHISFVCTVALVVHVSLLAIGRNETPIIHDLFLKLPFKICFNVSGTMHMLCMAGYWMFSFQNGGTDVLKNWLQLQAMAVTIVLVLGSTPAIVLIAVFSIGVFGCMVASG
jgi:hypothetical protein